MQCDVITTLRLQESFLKKNFLFVTKDTLSDLNFVLSDVISFYSKKNFSIILVNVAQSNSHYNHLLLKSGMNMRSLRDKGKIKVIDVFSEAEKILCDSENEKCSFFQNFNHGNGDTNSLKCLYISIKEAFEELCHKEESNCIVVIDEISMLMNVGLNMRSLQPFIQCCYSLCVKNVTPKCTFLIGSICDVFDEENSLLVSYLHHLADVRIQVEGLKTGYSQQVDGKITLEEEDKASGTSSHKEYLFKVADKGAQLMTLGL
ncbi:elongator complex protein 6-like [Uloborus diversus]|uniref:elongator complex protein 6-like n=1 Tax=Uloborus diversus TaxID=327109 RepID=UPI002409F029|nr:elongator complex protein 6-like [Uloborus diversus]